MEEPEEMQDMFIRQVLDEQTTDSTLTQRSSQLQKETLSVDDEQDLQSQQISSGEDEQSLPLHPERSTNI